MSSRWTGNASHTSACVSRLRRRNPVFASCRAAYTSNRPSGERAGRNAEPNRVDICDVFPFSRSYTNSWYCGPTALYCQSPWRAAYQMYRSSFPNAAPIVFS